MRIGIGYDVHPLVKERKLIIGGVEIDWSMGLHGHSDADVLIHAICDACLGAAGMGDIGLHYPPADERFKNADSRKLLQDVSVKMREKGLMVGNLDCIIVAERPKMRPYIYEMTSNIALDLGVSRDCINIKATTTEGLGYIGKEQGIAAQAVILLQNST